MNTPSYAPWDLSQVYLLNVSDDPLVDEGNRSLRILERAARERELRKAGRAELMATRDRLGFRAKPT